ncbi:FAD-binding oxidoreductase [Microbacterium pseudoresistens]|uniref:Alkyldihydroxyacetonephosphate synthase n=1 Tax=Microbacterium pseudoresistens TaxID=640634 RepID=A0A7Y9EUG4_9MICO|nr:FAD-binding oxidoreductase [Microbacterium pseudoresistens]NYD54182.1 alkyldihydroxyacetonephosphate synthase [Microbacterium pseudoresistens]
MTTTLATGALVDALGVDAVLTADSVRDAASHDTWPVATVWQKLGRHPYRPDMVVRVRSVKEIQSVVNIARESKTPLTARGLGSSVTGQPLPMRGGIVLDTSGLVGEPSLNEVDATVTVPAGVMGGDLETWLNERGYTLNHFPQSLYRSTLGGWVATRATGQFSSKYGGIENLLISYECVLADGTVAWLGQRPRAAMGPDLKQLLIGSEGTLGIVTGVTLKVFAQAEARSIDAFVLPDVQAGIDAMREIAQAELKPFLVRFYDADEARHAAPGAAADAPLLFLGSEGVGGVVEAEFAALTSIVERHGGSSIGAEPVRGWLGRRFDFSTVENLLATPGGYAETVEIANMWSRLPAMYDELKTALAPYADEVLGHFSHIYEQGSSLYMILLGHASNDEEALDRLETIWATAMEIVVAHDGEVSHHHGGGLARQAWVERSLGTGFPVLQKIKAALDPEGILNPGKLGM